MNVEYKYIRHLRLEGVGGDGQRRLSVARATLQATTPIARDIERRYLRGAGVPVTDDRPAVAGRAVPIFIEGLAPGPREIAEGAWAALAQIQDILGQNR